MPEVLNEREKVVAPLYHRADFLRASAKELAGECGLELSNGKQEDGLSQTLS